MMITPGYWFRDSHCSLLKILMSIYCAQILEDTAAGEAEAI